MSHRPALHTPSSSSVVLDRLSQAVKNRQSSSHRVFRSLFKKFKNENLRPVFCCVKNAKDMHDVRLDSVNDDVRQRGQYKFPRASFPASASPVRHLFQGPGGVIQSADSGLDVRGMVLLQIEADVFEVSGGSW